MEPVASVKIESGDESFAYVAEYLAKSPELLYTRQSYADIVAGVIRRLFYWMNLILSILTFGWLHIRNNQPPQDRRARALVCMTSYESDQNRYDESITNKPRFFLVPDDGDYIYLFNGVELHINVFTDKEAKQKVTIDYGDDPRRNTTLMPTDEKKRFTISILRGSERDIRGFIELAIESFFEKRANMTMVYAGQRTWRSEWVRTCVRAPRSIDSVILKSGVMEDLVGDIQSFLASEKWYQDHGIPYRRGYLLYGPPGTGKTSCIFALAGELKMNICIVHLASTGLKDSDLINLLTTSPRNSFLVLEDIDLGFGASLAGDAGKEAGAKDTESSKITLSGLLNALDGLAAQEGRIVFLTTNNIGSLSQALLRPGRCDRRFLFGHADRDVTTRHFVRFFAKDFAGGESEALAMGADVADRLEKAIEEGRLERLGVAELQGFFMRNRANPAGILDVVDGFVEEMREQKRLEEEERERVRKEAEKRKLEKQEKKTDK
ncbi:mitochondrial chaperone [Cladochytrium tenue]|nr:mitochondrial chaperone [Cladochytrium tenue]